MPRLLWLMFHIPISSPQRIKIFGCFEAIVCSFPCNCLFVTFPGPRQRKIYLKPKCDVECSRGCSVRTARSGLRRGFGARSIGSPFVAGLTPPKEECGERLPWQKRNFWPLPQGHGV